MENETQIVIAIPGIWPTRSVLLADIASKSNGLLFAGSVLMDTTTKKGYELQVYDHNPDLVKAFTSAGRLTMEPSDIEAIRSTTFTLYVIGQGGSLEQAQEIMSVGCGLIQAGGLAVLVDTTGKAHTSEDWLALASARNETALYHAFVTLVGGDGEYYSCGMHNVGQRDAIVRGPITSNDAARLLEAFLLYLLIEKPALRDGQTFSEMAEAPYYRLRAVPCKTYESGHRFFNPFGMWQLEPTRNSWL